MSNIKKHSKFKNTGILFELLVRQVTSDLMSNQDSKAVPIIKKFFKGTELSKDYNLYNTILNAPKLSEGKAEALINVVIEQSKKLDTGKLNKEKYNLIREIKKHYDVENFFKAKIDNYKISAAVFNLLESANNKEFTDTKTIIVNKLTILEHVTKELMTEAKVEKKAVEEFMKEDKDIRLLAYRILVEKFNTEYSTLSEEQKGILTEYINNVSDTKQLKLFLNNKIEQVKEEIEGLIPQIEDKVTVIKLTEVLNLIKPISERQSIKDENLVSLMQYYELVKEIKSSLK
jgi:hypothetical protein